MWFATKMNDSPTGNSSSKETFVLKPEKNKTKGDQIYLAHQKTKLYPFGWIADIAKKGNNKITGIVVKI